MKFLSLIIPGYDVQAPSGIPTTGLSTGGAGAEMIKIAIQLLLILGIVLALFFIIFAGIMWITSGGDKEKLQKARSRLTYSIIGLIVIFLAFFIINIIGGLFGINLIKQP